MQPRKPPLDGLSPSAWRLGAALLEMATCGPVMPCPCMSWPGMSLPPPASAAPRPSLGPCEERRLISFSWRPRQHPRRWNMGRMRGRHAGTRLSAGPPREGGDMPWGRTRDDTEVDLCRRPDDWARLEPKDVGRAWVVRESLLHHLARAEANTWGDRHSWRVSCLAERTTPGRDDLHAAEHEKRHDARLLQQREVEFTDLPCIASVLSRRSRPTDRPLGSQAGMTMRRMSRIRCVVTVARKKRPVSMAQV